MKKEKLFVLHQSYEMVQEHVCSIEEEEEEEKEFSIWNFCETYDFRRSSKLQKRHRKIPRKLFRNSNPLNLCKM